MKTLTAYFSASGTTEKKAKEFAEAVGSDIFEIKPEKPYTNAEINWRNPLSRCNKEWIKKADIALDGSDPKIGEYDKIYLFFPIWYFTAPLVIRSFLKAHDFGGKEIVMFATSGGSEFGKAAQQLGECAKGATVTEGAVLNGSYTADDYKAMA